MSRFRAVLFLTLLFLAGCGKGNYPVQGHVVFEDGAPAKELAGYTIMFDSEDHKVSANGTIQADGSFTVGTFQDGDGAMAGKQRVAITPPQQIDPRKPRSAPLIDAKYGSFETSKLGVEIKVGKNDVKIAVEKLKR